ncbi:hypothetical protein [Nostoc sp. LEGE 12450]|uniref:hypothetical protein n=1 Tax=Nostoc sp. LEGE 12450 TaxID=1828643 RepID=UPI0018821CA4|nr:hypothetical protein [Nostoc sp. LEGE 12450]MBE8986585.1 hypothetical protein [Nostoc sp. LEGE 12450]
MSSPKSFGCISRLWGAAQQLNLPKLRSPFYKLRSHQSFLQNTKRSLKPLCIYALPNKLKQSHS